MKLTPEQQIRLWNRLAKRFAAGQLIIEIDFKARHVRVDAIVDGNRHGTGSGSDLNEALSQLSRTT